MADRPAGVGGAEVAALVGGGGVEADQLVDGGARGEGVVAEAVGEDRRGDPGEAGGAGLAILGHEVVGVAAPGGPLAGDAGGQVVCVGTPEEVKRHPASHTGRALAEELAANAQVEASLTAFQARRWERCRMVVENSGRLGEIEMTGGDKDEHARIMRETLMALAAPI